MVDLIREVEEDLRRERYQKLWHSYGAYAVASILLLVLGVAGLVGWRAWVESKQIAASVTYETVISALQQDDSPENRERLERLAQTDASGYGFLALLREAAALEREGEKAAALAIYQSIYRDRRVPQSATIAPVFQDIARIYAGLTLFDGGAWEAIESTLRPLADSDRPGRLMAGEILALSALEQGYRQEALTIFRRILEDEDASPYIKERANALVTLFDVGQEEEEGESE